MIDFEEIADKIEPTDDELKTISGLVKRQVEIEDWIENQKLRLKEAADNLEKVKYVLLPEAMLDAGCSEYADDQGNKVTVKEDIKASITKANQDWCFDWLRENGSGDIIRNEFKITYGVGQDGDAKKLVETLQEQSQEFNQKEYVHPRTLPAWCRSELEENEHNEEWEKHFGIYRFKIAKITRP